MRQVSDIVDFIMTVVSNKGEALNFCIINVERFGDYDKLLRVTCRVRAVCKRKSLKAMLKEPTVEDVKEAESIRMKEIQIEMTD